MRGIASIANEVAPVAAIALMPGPLVSGPRKPISTDSPVSRAVSSALGAATLATTSAPHGSPIVGARVGVRGVGDARRRARPASITTSWPAAAMRRTTSGTTATRRSPSARLLGDPDPQGAGLYESVQAPARSSQQRGAALPATYPARRARAGVISGGGVAVAVAFGRASAARRGGRWRRPSAPGWRSPPGRRGGRAAASGSGLRASAITACAVTHTGVWRLVRE